MVDDTEDMRRQVRHPRLLELLDYWLKLRGGRRLPRKSEFDPAAVPRLLANLMLKEVQHDPLRFRIRLEGEQVSAARGFGATGRFFDEPGVVVLKDDALAAYAEMVADCRPRYSDGAFSYKDGRAGRLYRLALPFSGEGQTVDFIITGLYHELGRGGGW